MLRGSIRLVSTSREVARSALPEVTALPKYSRPAADRLRRNVQRAIAFVAVVLPTVLTFVYCSFLAAPLYTSEARFFVGGAAEAGGASAMAKIIPAGLSGGGSSSLLDGFAVRDYLNSYNALQELDSQVGFFNRYHHSGYDLLYKIREKPTRGEQLAFYRSMVKPRYNMTEGIVSIEVFAQTPDDALLITRQLRTMTEQFSNEMNRRALRGSVQFAEEELARAEQQLLDANSAMDRWRKENSDIDPEDNAKLMGGLISSLQMKYLETKATFDQVSSATKDSPQKQFLKNKLDALSAQIEAERSKLSSQQEKGSVVNRIADYQALKMQEEFKAKSYEGSLAALQGVRATAGFKQKYVLTIVEPTLADTPDFPRPLITTLIVFCLSLVAYGFLSLLASVILESRGR